MVKRLPILLICVLCICVGEPHGQDSGHAGFAARVPPRCESEIRRAHSGPSPGSEIPHPVPRVEQNSILFRELELVSLGVRNEHVSGTLLLKNSIKKKKKKSK